MPVASRTVSRRALVLLLALVAAVAVTGVAIDLDPGERRRAPAHRGPPHGRAQRARGVSRTSPSATWRARPASSGRAACPFTCTVQLPGTFLVVDAKQTDGSGTIALVDPAGADPHRRAARLRRAERVAARRRSTAGPGPFRVAHAGSDHQLRRDARRRHHPHRAAHRAGHRRQRHR